MVTLAFVGGIVLFILFDYFIMRPLDYKRERDHRKAELHSEEEPLEVLIPKGFLFAENHIWAHIRNDGAIALGMDEFLTAALGHLDKLDIPHKGRTIDKGETLFTLEHEGKQFSLTSPISGTVVDINQELVFVPEEAIIDPYCAGWLLELNPKQGHFEELAELKRGEEAASWMHEEMERATAWIEEHCSNTDLRKLLQGVSDDNWHSFDSTFLELGARAEG